MKSQIFSYIGVLRLDGLTLSRALKIFLLSALINLIVPLAPAGFTLTDGLPDAIAKKSKKRKAKRKKRRYDPLQREINRLLESGHPPVSITINTNSKIRATVYHGKEKLGSTPLKLTWAKDTGPVDIKVKASGYFTVNSRFYTHQDERVLIKMFKNDSEAHLLFGYKKKVTSKNDEDLESDKQSGE